VNLQLDFFSEIVERREAPCLT